MCREITMKSILCMLEDADDKTLSEVYWFLKLELGD